MNDLDKRLDRCPFDGGKAFLKAPKGMFSDQFYSGCCTKCGAEGPHFHAATCETPEESAVAAWNKRASPQAKKARS